MVQVSVITICLNNFYGLKKTVNSVAGQSYEFLEHIIVDGASSDETPGYLEGLTDLYNVRYISEKDDGRSDAFNKGTLMAEGELLLYLNSGDYFVSSDVVKNAVENWKAEPVDVLGYAVECDNGIIMHEDDSNWHTGLFAHQGLFIRKGVIQKVGLYNKYLINRMDYDLFLRFVAEGCTHRFVDEVIAHFDTSGISSTNIHNAELEGVGLRLIYNKSVTKNDIDLMHDLYAEQGGELSDLGVDHSGKNRDNRTVYVLVKALFNWVLDGGSFSGKLIQLGFKNVAIYGVGDVGLLLLKILSDTDLKVSYCIDRDKNKKIKECSVYQLDNIPYIPDVIIISNSIGIDNIRSDIKNYVQIPVYSVREIMDIE